jgi:2-dehydropantoate 2-reductase
MRICVFGAGNIGGYIGGRLAATGTDVVFVGRERLARTARTHGLTLTDWRGAELHVPSPRYETAPEAVGEADLVLVTVKSPATPYAAKVLTSLVQPGATVISFQNGLRNTEVLRRRLGDVTVLSGMVGFNVVDRGEGRLHCATDGTLAAQTHPSTSDAALLFARAGLPLRLHDDMVGVQAGKLLLNLNNAVNALSGLPLKTELSQRAYRKVIALAQREALAAYAAEGLTPVRATPLPPRWMPTLLNFPDALFTRVAARMLAVDPLARSSMWDDLDAERPTEVDYLNGEIVVMARRRNLPAPVNARLVELVHEAETGGRRDWSGPELLAEVTAGAS